MEKSEINRDEIRHRAVRAPGAFGATANRIIM
jgi:hypothetical protein